MKGWIPAHKHALYIQAITKSICRPHTHTHAVFLAVIRVQCVFLSGVIHQSDGCQWVSVSQTATANQSSIYLLFVSKPSADANAIFSRHTHRHTSSYTFFAWLLFVASPPSCLGQCVEQGTSMARVRSSLPWLAILSGEAIKAQLKTLKFEYFEVT